VTTIKNNPGSHSLNKAFNEKRNSHDKTRVNLARDSTNYASSTIESKFAIPQVTIEDDYDPDFDDN
jgi:hypothetical protein